MARQPALRPGWRLVAAVYPFAAGAAAVNLFLLSLVLSWIGLPVLAPGPSVAGGLVLGLPAAWAFARHLRGLIAKADGARRTADDPADFAASLRQDNVSPARSP